MWHPCSTPPLTPPVNTCAAPTRTCPVVCTFLCKLGPKTVVPLQHSPSCPPSTLAQHPHGYVLWRASAGATWGQDCGTPSTHPLLSPLADTCAAPTWASHVECTIWCKLGPKTVVPLQHSPSCPPRHLHSTHTAMSRGVHCLVRVRARIARTIYYLLCVQAPA